MLSDLDDLRIYQYLFCLCVSKGSGGSSVSGTMNWLMVIAWPFCSLCLATTCCSSVPFSPCFCHYLHCIVLSQQSFFFCLFVFSCLKQHFGCLEKFFRNQKSDVWKLISFLLQFFMFIHSFKDT